MKRRLLKFYTPSCIPCRQVTKNLEAILPDYPGLVVEDINVVEQPEVAAAFGVQSVPNLVLIEDGQPVAQRVGAATPAQLRELLDA